MLHEWDVKEVEWNATRSSVLFESRSGRKGQTVCVSQAFAVGLQAVSDQVLVLAHSIVLEMAKASLWNVKWDTTTKVLLWLSTIMIVDYWNLSMWQTSTGPISISWLLVVLQLHRSMHSKTFCMISVCSILFRPLQSTLSSYISCQWFLGLFSNFVDFAVMDVNVVVLVATVAVLL